MRELIALANKNLNLARDMAVDCVTALPQAINDDLQELQSLDRDCHLS